MTCCDMKYKTYNKWSSDRNKGKKCVSSRQQQKNGAPEKILALKKLFINWRANNLWLFWNLIWFNYVSQILFIFFLLLPFILIFFHLNGTKECDWTSKKKQLKFSRKIVVKNNKLHSPKQHNGLEYFCKDTKENHRHRIAAIFLRRTSLKWSENENNGLNRVQDSLNLITWNIQVFIKDAERMQREWEKKWNFALPQNKIDRMDAATEWKPIYLNGTVNTH